MVFTGSVALLGDTRTTFYGGDATKPLLLLADGAYLEDQARADPDLGLGRRAAIVIRRIAVITPAPMPETTPPVFGVVVLAVGRSSRPALVVVARRMS